MCVAQEKDFTEKYAHFWRKEYLTSAAYNKLCIPSTRLSEWSVLSTCRVTLHELYLITALMLTCRRNLTFEHLLMRISSTTRHCEKKSYTSFWITVTCCWTAYNNFSEGFFVCLGFVWLGKGLFLPHTSLQNESDSFEGVWFHRLSHFCLF